jgi:hypothetical protein
MAESILLRGFTVTAEPVSLPRLWATILKPLNHLPICAFLPTVSFGHAISWTTTEIPNVGRPPRIKSRVNSITNRKSITAAGALQRGDQAAGFAGTADYLLFVRWFIEDMFTKRAKECCHSMGDNGTVGACPIIVSLPSQFRVSRLTSKLAF